MASIIMGMPDLMPFSFSEQSPDIFIDIFSSLSAFDCIEQPNLQTIFLVPNNHVRCSYLVGILSIDVPIQDLHIYF